MISGSPTDVQPIFDAIVRSASRLCGGEYAIVTRYDGGLLASRGTAQSPARHGGHDREILSAGPSRDDIDSRRGRWSSRSPPRSDIDSEELDRRCARPIAGVRLRAVLAVPMIPEGRPIGVVSVSRGTAGPFSDGQIDLLRTFADQAVIAIENARLFNELQRIATRVAAAADRHRRRLKVISRSTFDLQPVFETLAESAAGSARPTWLHFPLRRRVVASNCGIRRITGFQELCGAQLRFRPGDGSASAAPRSNAE